MSKPPGRQHYGSRHRNQRQCTLLPAHIKQIDTAKKLGERMPSTSRDYAYANQCANRTRNFPIVAGCETGFLGLFFVIF